MVKEDNVREVTLDDLKMKIGNLKVELREEIVKEDNVREVSLDDLKMKIGNL